MKIPYRLKGVTLFLAAMLATGGLTTAMAPAQAAVDTGAVAGTVVDASGNPIDDIDVRLIYLDFEERYVKAEATTGEDGKFSFTDVEVQPPSDENFYYVEATDPDQDFLPDSEVTPVTAGTTTTTTLTMREAASISGKVTREDGKSPAGIKVYTGESAGTTTDANGNYALKGLEESGDTGSFLQFSDPAGDYLDQCFDNVLADPLSAEFGCSPYSVPDATEIKVPAGGHVTVKDQLLSNEAGHMTGKVTDTKGRVVKNAEVVLYDAAGNRLGGVPTMSSRTGAFRIDRIPPGAWKLNVPSMTFDGDLGWATYWWKNATTRAKATPITVKAGRTVSGLAIKLKYRAAITV